MYSLHPGGFEMRGREKRAVYFLLGLRNKTDTLILSADRMGVNLVCFRFDFSFEKIFPKFYSRKATLVQCTTSTGAVHP